MALQGANEILSGALHPLTTPVHVLILIGLALLLGQQIPLKLKQPMLVFAPLSAIALVLTTIGRGTELYQPLMIGIALCIAILVALEKKIPPTLLCSFCALAGISIGLDSGLQSDSTTVITKTLLGTWITINAVVGYLALCVSNGAEKPWARIAMRVVGSWIVAISLMVLAFSLRKIQ